MNNTTVHSSTPQTVFVVKEPTELMAFLMKAMNGISRTRAKALLANRVVSVNNVITTQYNHPLKPGMTVQVSKSKHNQGFSHPQLRIVFEDAYILVVEKKAGLLSVATEYQRERTAQHILQEYVRRKQRGARIYVVHRLDRETSGLMIYAKDEQTQHTLRDNWQRIVTDRRYVAVAEGEMEQDGGTIRSYLTDYTTHVESDQADNGEGKYSITHFHTIKRANGYSLLEMVLETGRRNQIRVHLSEQGHPIAGDTHYGASTNPINRLALHAFKLCFHHPVSGHKMEFETPYPEEFKRIVLRKAPDNGQGKVSGDGQGKV